MKVSNSTTTQLPLRGTLESLRFIIGFTTLEQSKGNAGLKASLGYYYVDLGKAKKAVVAFEHAIKIYEKLGFQRRSEYRQVLVETADVYHRSLKQSCKAAVLQKKSLMISKKRGKKISKESLRYLKVMKRSCRLRGSHK